MTPLLNTVKLMLVAVLLTACSFVDKKPYGNEPVENQFTKRVLNLNLQNKWIGNGISYGAYRDGEGPDTGKLTSKQHILEDLQIISARWHLIRLYGSGQQSRNILEVIRDNRLPVRVMQGAWLSSHKTRAENNEQVNNAIALANEFDEIIVAVNIGNEIFVDWSWHRMEDVEQVIAYIREARLKIKQPVTVNDDYNFWNKEHARKIVDEIDFIGLHAYAFWNNISLKDAMTWTEKTYLDIQKRYPEYLISYSETGWPTSRVYDDSYEGQLIGVAGEDEQKIFFDWYDNWVNENKVVSLYFEAFDENWKGGFDGLRPMDKAEKHWGVYRSDRRPKKLLQ